MGAAGDTTGSAGRKYDEGRELGITTSLNSWTTVDVLQLLIIVLSEDE
jgi:hypothetical protein